ncbi:hypothetical protein PIROE2DRAFT_10130 [Piromyces sp. E2]|nr:hypothetical protein PIROE2DRAFT_10130 [Piromyces sp. E2]|eukprot:OUM63345.1 hypothetical protein PIROE2DRAFT_10130 [Piromyces sp. E2]
MQNNEFNSLYEFIKKVGVHEIISNNKKINDLKLQFKLLNEDDIILGLYLVAIDCKNVESINNLNNNHFKECGLSNNRKEYDILNNIYKRKQLDLSIIENKDMESLKLLCEYFFCDNNFIKAMIYAYKFKSQYIFNDLDNIMLKEIGKFGLNQLSMWQKYCALALALENRYDYLVEIIVLMDIKIKNNKRTYPLFWLCNDNHDNYNKIIEMVQLLIEYTNNNGIILDLNEKYDDGWYPFLWACNENKIKMVHILMDYAVEHNIILELNEIDETYGFYPLLLACYNNNTEIVSLLIEYANKNNIILEMNDFNNYYENYPLAMACNNNNIEIMKILITYANKYNIELDVNTKVGNNNYVLLMACDENNVDTVQLLIDYVNNNNILLELNEKDYLGYFPLFMACFYNNIEINMDYPLLTVCENNGIETVKLLMEYANQKNIILELNDANIIGWYPILWACYHNNVEMVLLLMEYANKHKIILEMDRKTYEDKMYPLLLTIKKHKNIKMVQLIMDYAKTNNIILRIDERDLGNIAKIPNEIMELFNKNKNIINITCKENSKLLKLIK